MKIIIVDDDKIVTTALKTIVEIDNDIRVVAVGSDGTDAILLYEKYFPDILLMDIRMKNMSGIEAGKIILSKHSDAKIIFLTTFDTDEYIIDAFKMGAKGYLLKHNYESLPLALKFVMQNGRVFGDDIIQKINIKEKKSPLNLNAFDINEKELELIKCVADGLSNKEISTKLFLSEGTVRNYLSCILEKTKLRDRTQLAIFYYKNFI